MKELLSRKFISASSEMCSLEKAVASPYLRKRVEVKGAVSAAALTVCGLGFYRLWLNGKELTRGLLSPYITNPDNILDYDKYDLTDMLEKGESVLGFQLGNGMQNALGGFVWDFDKAAFRSAPKLAAALEIEYKNGDREVIETDESFLCHPSPIVFDDLRMGESYDAREEIDGWCEVGYDDSEWTPAIKAEAPKGKPVICLAAPIEETHTLAPVSIKRGKWHPSISNTSHSGYIYDFGENNAGIISLKIMGRRGQRVTMTFGELLHDGDFYTDNISFIRPELSMYPDYVQSDTYICRGEGVEEYRPSFTYHGFRYVFVEGIDEEQATEELLTYHVMHTELHERGAFRSSCEKLNKLQEMTRRATLANFWHFPNDCPHREKNGWTADAALSAEHTLLNLDPYDNYREWMRHISASLDDRGALPGIVPTGGWGFSWGNGPAWDQVIVELPYMGYRYTGRTEIAEENMDAIMTYIRYLETRVDERGLIEIGLGDWCAPHDIIKSPLVFTDSVTAKSICDKAAQLAAVIGREDDRKYCEEFSSRLKRCVRDGLIDLESGRAVGDSQTSQAMAIYYGIVDGEDADRAFDRLLEYIDREDNHLDTGVLGGRVIFHVLAERGYADLAYEIMLEPSAPSYGQWLEAGYTTLAEDFFTDDERIQSKNHHFWGDISAFFIKRICGINYNPNLNDTGYTEIKPCFIEKLDHAEAHFDSPRGRVSSSWRRVNGAVVLEVSYTEGMNIDAVIANGYIEAQRENTDRGIKITAYKMA